MRKKIHSWIGLLALCLMLIGCSGEEQDVKTDRPADESDQIPMRAEVIVEPTEQTLTTAGQPRKTAELIQAILTDDTVDYPAMAIIEIDEDFKPSTRVRFWVEIAEIEGLVNDETISALADQTYSALKTEFDARTKQALADEVIYQQSLADAATKDVKQLQQTLQTFQETRRGVTKTNASRLERRTLERQIETTLQAQIDASKQAQELQRRIDRDTSVTLVRVR